MYTHEWTTREIATAKGLYEDGLCPRFIASKVGRTRDAVNRMACREGWKRPIGWKYFRQNDSWDEILEALQASDHPLEVPEIASITGRTEALIYKRLKERRGKYVHVEAWRTTMSKPAAKWALGGGIDAPKPISGKWSTKPDANPFLVALGAVAAPKNHRGRVIEMLDEPETEEQLA